jgi:glycosyltransferase involved in cell wall biosynthesis
MISTLKVSVVMPAYNAEAYLDEAVTSILGQTFRDFEFIIINDGSTDDTASILDKYEKSDSRIRVYHQENQGMIAALNRGCCLARGKYIARMDADDVSFPARLEKQLEYIERDQKIGILGTWIHNIDKNGVVRGTWRPPTNSKMLKWTLFFGVCVAHPSVVMRRDLMTQLKFYRPDAAHVEDVDLWFRASSLTEFGNVPEVLLKYRIWTGSTHQRGLEVRSDRHVQLLASYIKDVLNIDPPIEAVAGLRQIRVGPRIANLRQVRLTAALIEKLHENFTKENNINSQERREISWDAAKKLASLALQALRFNTADSMSLFLQALRLDYRLLYPAMITRGLARAFEQKL